MYPTPLDNPNVGNICDIFQSGQKIGGIITNNPNMAQLRITN